MLFLGHELMLELDPPSQSAAVGPPILTRGAMKPRPSPGLKAFGVWQHILLNTWEKNWHLIHRNKTTSKDSNGYSCSQESPPITPAPSIAPVHCPLEVFVSTSTQIQDSSVSSSSFLLHSSLLPNSNTFSMHSF